MIENIELWPTFDLINIKRDPVNNVGQLVVFQLSNYWDIRKKPIEEGKKMEKEEDKES